MRVKQAWYDHLKQEFNKQGFPAYCGIEVLGVDHGVFETRLVVDARHQQQDGLVHAGVIATMADHTAGYAAYTTVSDQERILTVEYKINFLKPAAWPELVCRSTVISGGKTLIVTESEVAARRGSEEKMVGKAQLTMMAVPAARLRAGSPTQDQPGG